MGLFSKGGDAPAPPDPRKTAEIQREFNLKALGDSRRYSDVGRKTPYGSVRYVGTPGTPDYRQVVTLPEESERALDNLRKGKVSLSELFGNRARAAGGGLLSQEFSTDGLSPRGEALSLTGPNRVEEAFYKRTAGLLNPRYARERSALRASLAGQGISPGSARHREAMDELNRRERQQFSDLATASVGEGVRAQGQQFDQLYRNRSQQYLEDVQTRDQIIDELQMLLGLSTPEKFDPGNPVTFGADAANYQGAAQSAYQGQLNAWQQRRSEKSSLFNSLISAGAKAGAAYLGGPAGAAAAGAAT